MLDSPLLLFSSLTIATAGLASLVVFLLSFEETSRLHNASLRQWALAFFLFTWIRIPTVLAAAGASLPSTLTELVPAYIIATIALIAAYVLFYRGTMMLLTTRKFWLNTFPVVIFVALNFLIFVLLLWFQVPVVKIIDIVSIFSYTVILFLILATIKLLWALQSTLAKKGLWLTLIGWIMFLIANTHLVQIIHNYPQDFWFFALTSSPTAYIYLGFTVAHLFILLGIVLTHKHEGRSNTIQTSAPLKDNGMLSQGI